MTSDLRRVHQTHPRPARLRPSRTAFALLPALLVLAACAPTLNAQYRVGRVVNVTTGEEGRVLLGGYGTVAGRNTATLEFGQVVYQGEYNVLAAVRPGDVRLNLGAGVVFSNQRPPEWFGVATVQAPNVRDGSIIARNAAGQVITCTFVVDQESHGNGTCTDAAGHRYAMQF